MKKSIFNSHLVACTLIVLMSICLYKTALRGDFIWDDSDLIIAKAAYLNDWKNLYRVFVKPLFGETPYYRPLLTVSFIIDYQMWGDNPFGFHYTNLILHIVNGLAVYLFAFLLFKKRVIALLTSLLFTAHPVQSEAVAWVSGRNDVLLTLFALISILLHLRWTDLQGWRRVAAYACCQLAYMAALLTKESAMVLLPLCVLVDYFYSKTKRNIIRGYAGYVLITMLYYCIRLAVIGSQATGTPEGGLVDTFLGIMVTYAYYFKMLLFPVFQSALPEIPGGVSAIQSAIYAGLLMVSLAAVAIIFSKRFKEIPFAILWVFISLIPVCGILPLSIPALEHRLYLGTVCFSMLLPSAVNRLSCLQTGQPKSHKTRITVAIMVLAVLLFYSAKTVTRNTVWENELSFWLSTVLDSPRSTVARNNLGIAYAHAGKHDMAIQAFQQGLALHDHWGTGRAGHGTIQPVKLLNNLGQSYYKLLEKHIANEADTLPAVADIGTDSEEFGDEAERLYRLSRACYQKALKVNPESDKLHNNLGDLFYIMKNYAAAEMEYREALKICPGNAEYYNNLGLVYYGLKNYTKAEEKLSRALLLKPDFSEARNNLALVYLQSCMYQKALDELERVLLSKPGDAGVYFNLALIYQRGFNDREKAVHYMNQGLKLTSGNLPDDMISTGLKNIETAANREN